MEHLTIKADLPEQKSKTQEQRIFDLECEISMLTDYVKLLVNKLNETGHELPLSVEEVMNIDCDPFVCTCGNCIEQK